MEIDERVDSLRVVRTSSIVIDRTPGFSHFLRISVEQEYLEVLLFTPSSCWAPPITRCTYTWDHPLHRRTPGVVLVLFLLELTMRKQAKRRGIVVLAFLLSSFLLSAVPSAVLPCLVVTLSMTALSTTRHNYRRRNDTHYLTSFSGLLSPDLLPFTKTSWCLLSHLFFL